MSQHMGSPSLGAEVSYFAEVRISVNSTEECCVCIWKCICQAPHQSTFRQAVKMALGAGICQTYQGRVSCALKEKPEQKSHDWEGLMRDKGQKRVLPNCPRERALPKFYHFGHPGMFISGQRRQKLGQWSGRDKKQGHQWGEIIVKGEMRIF